MTTRERRRGGRRRRTASMPDPLNTNPMDSLSNFSDVMLVLAVGILLALVLHWKVPIGQGGNSGTGSADGQAGEYAAASLGREDLTQVEKIPDDSERIGSVYYDEETGSYYILQE